MGKQIKKRSMNELRQVKEYKHPKPRNQQKMSYWVVYREQVSLELKMDMFSSHEEAWSRRQELYQQYYDVIVLETKDVEKLYHYQKSRKHEE